MRKSPSVQGMTGIFPLPTQSHPGNIRNETGDRGYKTAGSNATLELILMHAQEKIRLATQATRKGAVLECLSRDKGGAWRIGIGTS